MVTDELNPSGAFFGTTLQSGTGNFNNASATYTTASTVSKI